MMITVREMELDDLDEVLVIENSLFSVPWSANGFFSFLLRDDTLFLVAEEEGRICGFCGVVMVLNEGDVTNVAVAKESQGRGIGRTLMEALVQKTVERGVDTLHLEVRKSNESAIALYKKLAFEEVGLRPRYYEEPVEDAVLMRKVSPLL